MATMAHLQGMFLMLAFVLCFLSLAMQMVHNLGISCSLRLTILKLSKAG